MTLRDTEGATGIAPPDQLNRSAKRRPAQYDTSLRAARERSAISRMPADDLLELVRTVAQVDRAVRNRNRALAA
jgi:hypothetical protein